MSLSPTLGRNEKVEQHIRKKTHKPNALRFWVEGGVIPLYVGSVLILGIKAVSLQLGRVQFDPVSKVFLMVISGKRVTCKCMNSNVLGF